jgi:RecG-like helicase
MSSWSNLARNPNASARTTTPAEDHEARELLERAVALGAQPISEVVSGVPVSVAGTVRRVTLRPATDTMRFEADLFDGTGHVTLIWLGRRRIAALNVGRFLVAHGRVTDVHGHKAIYNPVYELQTH